MIGMRGKYRRNLQPCGTPAAWRRHHARGEYPCLPCADAWNAYVETNRARRNLPPRSRDALYLAALDGREPAEALTTRDRATLVFELHYSGFTDVEIAERTRMTLYTTARIRDRLGLPANRAKRVDLGEAVA